MAYNDQATEADDVNFARTLTKIGVGCVLGLILVIGSCSAAMPQYNLYKANTQKRERIAEARAEADSADYKAEAAVKRAEREADAARIKAQGVADAQQIIAGTLTPEYITWLFVDTLGSTSNQIIYVPTEGGLPILEANRGGAAPPG